MRVLPLRARSRYCPAMSEADFERIKAVQEAFNEGDFESLLGMFDDDAKLQRLGGLETLRGREAIRAWLAPDAIEYQRGDQDEKQALKAAGLSE